MSKFGRGEGENKERVKRGIKYTDGGGFFINFGVRIH